jgi:hypothetical protein
MQNKLFYAISWATIIAAILTLIISFYWYFFPKMPITFSGVHKVLTPVVEGGEYLSYTVNYCKDTNVIPSISKSFVDGIVYDVPLIISESFRAGCGSIVAQIYIPKTLSKGMYYLQTTYHYQVNPIRDISIVTTTEKFEVK